MSARDPGAAAARAADGRPGPAGRAAPRTLSGAALAAAWLAVPAAAAALGLAIATLRRPLARALASEPTAAQLPLPNAAGDVRPEPLEQALYLLALVVPPLVVWGLALAAPRLRRPRPSALEAAALGVQAALAVAVVATVEYQARRIHSYFPAGRWALGLAATLAVLAAAHAVRRSGAPARLAARAPRAWAAAALAAAAAYTGARLASSVFDDASVLAAPVTVSYHLPFTLGEFAAVLNGRTPGVDFFPQYASLLPYALAPVFRATGLTVGTFTLAMATLSSLALLLQYDVLRRATGGPWVALALYVPFVALALHPVEVFPNGDVATAFSYYAVGPLRYLGPWVVGWLVAWHLSRPSAARATLVVAAATAAALNNLDFGIPALGGALLALALAGETPLLPGPRALLRLAGGALAGAALALALFQALSFAHSGRLVSLPDMTVFQRAFAVLGFGMIPLRRWGIHWVVYATFMLGLGTAIVRLAAVRAAGAGADGAAAARERLLCGVLVQGSVFGAGALSYYIGRSHPAVLPAVFAAWGGVLVLLAWLALRGARAGGRLRALPALLGVAALALGAGHALPYRFPLVNMYEGAMHLGPDKVRWVLDARAAAARLREQTAPGERVMISSPAGHLVAELAGVENTFPFVEWDSCLVTGQLDEILRRLRTDRVSRWFGPASPELRRRVAAEGLPVAFHEAPAPR